MGAQLERIVTGGEKASVKLAQFKAVNTVLGNLKSAISGTYHAFDCARKTTTLASPTQRLSQSPRASRATPPRRASFLRGFNRAA